MSQKDMEQAEKLWKERARGRAYLDVESTGDDVESEAEWCQEVLGNVFNASAKEVSICTQSRRWWNGEIKHRRSKLGREKSRRSRSAETAQAKAELQKSIQRAKDRMWDDYLQDLRGAAIWRASGQMSRLCTVSRENPRPGQAIF
jgi:hypothetical protein